MTGFHLSDTKDTSESLPSWLEQKKCDNVESSVESAVNSDVAKTKSAEIHNKNESTSTKIEATKHPSNGTHISESVADDMNDEFKGNHGKHVVSDVRELKRKRDELMERLRTETESLTQQEQEIYSSAVELMLQQRDNVKTLFQIISFDDLFENKTLSNTTESDIRSRVKYFEDTIVQLQKKLAQEQLEKVELEMRLKHMEHKHKIDLTMLEDVYKYKLHLAEEKDAHNKQAIQFLESDYNMKLSKRKENEEELIQMYNDKIQMLKEEHMKELKHAAELHNLKSSWRSVVSETKDSESLSDRELTLREIAVEEKRKQLLELEERLNKQKLALEGKESSLDAKIEEFDVRTMKEKLHLDQQKKELKLSQNILEEKQTYWQRELHREKEHLLQSKKELETMKDELLNEERKLTKQKFELCSERVRIEAIINAEGNKGGCVKDIIQSRAELHGTVDELQQLKSQLERERNEVKKEELHLKEEGWKLRMIEQQLTLQRRQFEKAIQESERKRDEGIEALARAQKIESHINERAMEVERQLIEVKRKEELLVQEKIELSRERELLAKKRSQLDMILPQLTLEEQLPFSLLNKNILDPRVTFMKLNPESILDE